VETQRQYLTYEDYEIEDLLVYAGIDCIVTSELARKLSPIVTRRDKYFQVVNGKATEIWLPSIAREYSLYTNTVHEYIIDMELNGFKYDIAGNEAMKIRMEKEIQELEDEIFKAIGKTINLDSGADLAELLYDKEKGYGLEVTQKTKTGESSTDGDALKDLFKRYPEHTWLVTIAKRNDISSLYRTFIVTYVKDFVKGDGRIHPTYNLHGTSSGRPSGEEPNLTQLPRTKHGYNIRSLYIVDKGYIFIAFDYSSAEVKILGALCKDAKLLKAIEDGLDFHSYSACEMNGLNYEEFVAALDDPTHPMRKEWKLLRQYSKALTFGILYGSTPKGIAFNLQISEEKARELIALYFDQYPGIQQYVSDTHAMAKLNGYVITPFGRRKMEFGANKVYQGTAVYNGALRNSQNVRVQSTASEFALQCFARYNTAIKPLGGKALATVYDSTEAQIPIPRAAEALELGFVHLEEEPVRIYDWLDLPVAIDAEIGTSWGNAVKVKRGTSQAEIEELLKRF
jgi:DNA polymerase I